MPPRSRTSQSSSRAAAKPARTGKAAPQSDIDEIDSLFQMAGLVRSRREKPADVRSRAKFQPITPEELRPAPADPVSGSNGVQFVPVPGWASIKWLWHGFSTRKGGESTVYAQEGAGGELNLSFTAEDDRELVLQNRRLLAEAVSGSAETPILAVRQIHSSVLVMAAKGQHLCKGDGLMTDEPGVLLGIQTADCIPVLVADRKRKAVAAFHAGWRGTVKRIVETGIGRMRLEFGSRPEDLVAAIGPGIGPCCYAVGDEVRSEFESQFTYAEELFREVYDTDPIRTKYPMLFLTQRAPGHSPIGPSTHLDLMEANRRQLLAAGLKPKAIQVVGGCTSCQPDLFFSHRASRGRTGRMMSVIGIAK